MNEKKAGVKSFFKKIKPEYVLLVAAAVAVIALFLSNYSYAKTQTSADTAAEYVETLEKKLSICQSVFHDSNFTYFHLLQQFHSAFPSPAVSL